LYLAATTVGENMDENEISYLLDKQMTHKLAYKQMQQFAGLLKKYPEQDRLIESSLEQASENIAKIRRLIS
jgi:hypothetical protein